MKFLVLDGGKGGKNFIEIMKREGLNKKNKILFQKIFNNNVNYKKDIIRKELLNYIKNYSNKDIDIIVIACNAGSSSILDILIKNNFILHNIKIYEPIIPMCNYIIKKKYKNILVMGTFLTNNIKWHKRYINNSNINIKYLAFDTLYDFIDDNNSIKINKSLENFKKQKDFLKISDCLVLGCTHYNIIKKQIYKYLKFEFNFKGDILDSNEITFQYLMNSNS